MKPKQLKQWYIKNGWPLKCRYCGAIDNLTTDHIIPKCKVPQSIREKRWRNRDKDPQTYFGQFVFACNQCNYMKGWLSHEKFVEHINKIINHIKS